mmetsp:Transcript_128640/g.305265  ORF Transcript_128640/g.305265 Transcript_128640/m.305265 type:complete len:108 (-) Transcript_128640:1117-1440(-)
MNYLYNCVQVLCEQLQPYRGFAESGRLGGGRVAAAERGRSGKGPLVFDAEPGLASACLKPDPGKFSAACSEEPGLSPAGGSVEAGLGAGPLDCPDFQSMSVPPSMRV